MSYYKNRKPFVAMAAIFIGGGVFQLAIGIGVGGVMIGSGILMCVALAYHAKNPVLEIHPDHLVYDPAPVRAERFIAREDVESVDVAGDDLLIALHDGEVVKLRVKDLALANAEEMCGELNDWKAAA